MNKECGTPVIVRCFVLNKKLRINAVKYRSSTGMGKSHKRYFCNMPARFVIQQRENYYGFQFESEMQNIILFSRLFRTWSLCTEGIRELISTLNTAERFEKLQDKHGQFSFVVRSKKGTMLGHSATYYASSTRDHAMKQLMHQAAQANIIEGNPGRYVPYVS